MVIVIKCVPFIRVFHCCYRRWQHCLYLWWALVRKSLALTLKMLWQYIVLILSKNKLPVLFTVILVIYTITIGTHHWYCDVCYYIVKYWSLDCCTERLPTPFSRWAVRYRYNYVSDDCFIRVILIVLYFHIK